MAYNSTDQDPKLLKVVGETTEMCCGIDTASGSALTVTCPQLATITGVVATAYTSGAVVSVTATSSNTFTVATTNASDVFAWIAWGKAKI